MFILKVIDSGISYEFYARKSLIEPILLDASRYFKRLGFGSSIHGFKIVARQLMSNAIEHGCKNSPTEKINLCIRKAQAQSVFEITVQEQGDVFEFGKLEFSSHRDGVKALNKQGYTLIHEPAQDICFDKSGSWVRVYLEMNDV